MGIFSKYTIKSLAKNKMRTFVTIVGIVLSVALSTAVVQGANSGVHFIRNAIISEVGDWNIYYRDISDDGLTKIEKNKDVEKIVAFDTVGWGDIKSENVDKPYLLVKTTDKRISKSIAVNLLKGRMPENSSEILLPDHLEYNGAVTIKNGDTFTIELGERKLGDEVLGEEVMYSYDEEGISNEELVNTKSRTYTVVGIYSRTDYKIEDYECPGYTAITVGEEDIISKNKLVTLKNPGDTFEFNNKMEGTIEEYKDYSGKAINNDVAHIYGGFTNNNINKLLYSFVAILLIIISFGSIALIYNSFSISVSERVKQFGVLKSIGATKKQIRGIVFREALFLSIIAIPVGLIMGCVGIGITLFFLEDSFATMFGNFAGVGPGSMKLSVSVVGLLVVSVICLFTTFIAAYIPARKAMNLNPIEAVRQNDSIKLKRRAVKASFIARKLFGFEGMMASKNFKRSKKKYRTTVVSLFVSIVLFISASAFCNYLSTSIEVINGNNNNADIYMSTSNDNALSELDEIKKLSNVTEHLGVKGVYFPEGIWAKDSIVSEKYMDYLKNLYREEDAYREGEYITDTNTEIMFLDKANFDKLCEDNGVDPKKYHDINKPLALAYNRASIQIYDPKEKTAYWKLLPIFDANNDQFALSTFMIKNIDGYVYYSRNDYNDKLCHLYFKEDSGFERMPSEEEIDSYIEDGTFIRVSDEEAKEEIKFMIDGEVDKLPHILGSSAHCIVFYSEEMLDVIFKPEQKGNKYLYADYVDTTIYLSGKNADALYEEVTLYADASSTDWVVNNIADEKKIARAISNIINVFSYGFIILISLVALANVFNSIATNINLRHREFAMLKTVGMSEKSFRRMMRYECIIYGVKSLMYGLPVAILATYGIYLSVNEVVNRSFYIPWYSLVIAIGSVFVVVFATMVYATSKIKKKNLIESLKSEIL